MNEPSKPTISDLLGRQKNLICRLIFFAKITSSELVYNFFIDHFKSNYIDKISGLLIVYPTYIIHLIESDEDVIFRVCSEILENENSGIEEIRHFPVLINATDRLFPRWYARKIVPSSSPKNKNYCQISGSIESMRQIKPLYIEVFDKLCEFFWQFKTSNSSDLKKIVDKLDNITEKEALLPSSLEIEMLLTNYWGFDLAELVKKYWHSLESKEADIWPVPKMRVPPIQLESHKKTL